MVAGEVRGAQWASIVASVGTNDSRRGTRGQLVGGTVEVQLADHSRRILVAANWLIDKKKHKNLAEMF